MSRTTRKDRYDRVYKLKPKSGGYVCNCSYCTGVDKKVLSEKIARKDMHSELNRDFISEFDECIKFETNLKKDI